MFTFADNESTMIYLAPIQGFTDYIYRKVYAAHFSGIDAFFVPYISVKNNALLKKYIREIIPENNPLVRTVPQVLAKDPSEMLFLSNEIKKFGYTELNLNMGCPYPMVTNRGRGSGLLPHPNRVREMLSVFFENSDLKLSVKLRAGLHSTTEIDQIIPVLNQFPLTEIIFHPRTADQLYKGKIQEPVFKRISEQCVHPLVFNGDIFSLADYEQNRAQFTVTKTYMLGRGVLMNVFLPAEIKGAVLLTEEKRMKRAEFHQDIFRSYMEKMDNPGNALNKLKQFWIYFSHNFTNQRKVLKLAKKCTSIESYLKTVQKIFSS